MFSLFLLIPAVVVVVGIIVAIGYVAFRGKDNE